MLKISITEFLNRFDQIVEQARAVPIKIENNGKRELILMSASHHDWLVAAARRGGRTADAPDFVIEAVRNASMKPNSSN
jgi:hypothetical protein